MNKTALKAVAKLCSMDHGILPPKPARAIATEMGLDGQDVPTYPIEHQPNEFKGASLAGCTETGQKRFSIGADELAEWACQTLKLDYVSKFGRGSRLRECCSVLYKHFGGK